MATLKHADSKKNMYSWWWNSHISPKNSKWLQENLTDMDVKVKSMIKLIEEDADSFARRAEMYYKKRPELMKLVEEFYRAYRALAERYDHATGALRQAHQTMAEAFPNQVPMNPDDSANSDAESQAPEFSTPSRALFESEDLQKGGGKKMGAFSEGFEGRVRKGLNFNMGEEDGGFSESKKGGKLETEIVSLKDSLAKIEAEKEAALIQYEESLERLSKLGLEVALAQRKSRESTERANKVEAEAKALKEALLKLEAEKEGTLMKYRECLERTTSLENDLSRAKDDNALLDERAQEAELEAESLKQNYAKLEDEKEALLDQYEQSLKMISDLEDKLRRSEEDARKFSEHAEEAEGEIVILKEMIAKLTGEKEAEGVLYQQCLKTIASLEHKLLLAQEEAERLNGEIDDGVAKLKGAEEQCVVLENSNESLHAELESMVLKMGSQSQELTEKQKELGRLWSSIQEERVRFVEAETAFQTLQHLHSQAQDELRSMASELESRAHILEDMETRNQSLQDEILRYKEENKNLTNLNLASATLTKDMRDEIFSLKESKGKLEDEIDLRTDQRNALQQEIYSLKEELNELNRKHRGILEQVNTVGLNPEFLGSSVKELQDDNLNLKEVCQRERSERLALLEKLEIKENSLADLQEEILKCKEENKTLNELNLATAALSKDMRDEIFSLKESKEKLEEEVDRRVDQGNTLQQEIDSLKEELNKLNRDHRNILEQVDAVGLKPESIGSSVKDLQDENSNLKEVSEREKSEKLALLEKLAIMGQLIEKNAVLENSLSDLSAELENVRRKLKIIEDSCRSLLEEKSTLTNEKANLVDQLRVTTEELEKVTEKNSVMENSLSDAHAELEVLKSKSKDLEDSCQFLNVEKSALITEKGSLVYEIEITQGSLKDLEIRYAELEAKCLVVERERASTLSKVEELEKSLAVQKQEHDHYAEMNSEQLAGMEGQIRQLKEEGVAARKEFEEQLAGMEGQIRQLKEEGVAATKEFEEQLAVMEGQIRQLEEEGVAARKEFEEQLAVMEGQIRQLEEEGVAARKEFEEQLGGMEGQIRQLKEEGVAARKEFEEELEKSLALQKLEHDRYAQMTSEQLAGMEGQIHQLKEEGIAARKEFEEELEKSLAVQKQEHDHYAQMTSEQLAGMEGQIRQLKEEGMATRKEFDEELDKGFNLQNETFILVRCIKALEEKNFSLVNDFQKLLEASKSSENLIFEMEKEKTKNQVTIKSLSDHIDALRVQMQQLLMVFDIGVDRDFEDLNGHDQTCLNHILSKAEDTKLALSETEDESRQLAVEVSVLVTLLTQLRTGLSNLETEKDSLDRELTAKNEKLLELQGEAQKLHERNEELVSKLMAGEQQEEVLIAQIENLRAELLEIHGAYGDLQAEKLQVCKEKMVLMTELSDVEDRVHAVEGQNSTFIDELYDQSVLAIVLKNYLEEKSVAISALGEDLDKVNGVNTALLEKLTITERELEGVKMENRDLKERLEKSEHELETVAFVSDELNCEILNVKNLLGEKEREFSEAEEKLKLTEDEKTELHEIIEDLKREYDDIKMTSEEQGKQILELSDTNNYMRAEQISLQETSQMLELGLHQLREEHEKMISELELEAEEIYGEFQTSTICQALLVLKVRELAEAFVSLQEKNMSKDMNIEALENENGGLQSQLASYGSALVSLRDCIVSLENRTRSKEDVKGAELGNVGSVEGSDEFSDFLDLQNRIKTIENSLIELERLRMQENADANTKLESVTRQMEELKLQQSYHKKERKQTSEILEVGTKDIVLDQESESSSQTKSKREGESQVLDSWAITDQDDNIDLTVGRSKRTVEPQSKNMLLEKELGVDKLEMSKRFKEPQEAGNKGKVLERLNSDDQKLTNLHITVQDLKKKVEITEKGKKGKSVVECDTLKAQLEEAEAAIQKLFDLTAKLMKNIEESSITLENSNATELEESKSTRRKRISEQARRISEKIGRLQLEVQKIQFALLKLDDANESKGRSRYLDVKRRVALKDYLYGGGRTKATIHRKKKAPFCSCMNPPTSD